MVVTAQQQSKTFARCYCLPCAGAGKTVFPVSASYCTGICGRDSNAGQRTVVGLRMRSSVVIGNRYTSKQCAHQCPCICMTGSTSCILVNLTRVRDAVGSQNRRIVDRVDRNSYRSAGCQRSLQSTTNITTVIYAD